MKRVRLGGRGRELQKRDANCERAQESCQVGEFSGRSSREPGDDMDTTAGEEHGEGSGAHDSRDREFPGVPPTLSQVPNPQLSISLNLCFTIKSSAYLISMQMNPSWRDAAQDMIRGRRRDARVATSHALCREF
ncbi:hypothetical protein M758_11G091400 [Ceratodon purpureus]|nr:hypothetical protein M758_11G091400 [Ceratodon purpureus]